MIGVDLGQLGESRGGCEKYQEKQVLARTGIGTGQMITDDLEPLGGASGGCEKSHA